MTTKIFERDEFLGLLSNNSIIREIFKNLESDSLDMTYYQGDIDENDKLSGYGKLFNNLLNYHGNFKDNNFHGTGKLILNKDAYSLGDTIVLEYDGEFNNGEVSGFGRVNYIDEFFIGNFKTNKKDGLGTKYNNNGKVIFEKSAWKNDYLVETKPITLYYDSGTIMYKGGYNGIYKEGEGTLYDKFENPIYIGEFKNDKYHGKGTMYQSKKIKKNGGTEGQLGFVMCEGNFTEGDFSDGNIYDSLGDLAFEGSFQNNTLPKKKYRYITVYGKGKMYSGKKLYFDGVFDDSSSKLSKIITALGNVHYGFKNGIIYSGDNKTYINYEEGKENGEKITYRGNTDEIISKYQMKNGMRHGDFEEYNGKMLSRKGSYKNDNISGECISYFNDGSLHSQGEYKNGVLSKGTIYYMGTNEPKYIGTFNKFGRYDGDGVLYFGNLKNAKCYEGKFKNGKYEGEGTLWYKNSNKHYEGSFLNGTFDGSGTCFREDTGLPEYIGHWRRGKKHGEGTLIDSNGMPIISGAWVNDEFDH